MNAIENIKNRSEAPNLNNKLLYRLNPFSLNISLFPMLYTLVYIIVSTPHHNHVIQTLR